MNCRFWLHSASCEALGCPVQFVENNPNSPRASRIPWPQARLDLIEWFVGAPRRLLLPPVKENQQTELGEKERHVDISVHVSWLEQKEDKRILIRLRVCDKVAKHLGSSSRARLKKSHSGSFMSFFLKVCWGESRGPQWSNYLILCSSSVLKCFLPSAHFNLESSTSEKGDLGKQRNPLQVKIWSFFLRKHIFVSNTYVCVLFQHVLFAFLCKAITTWGEGEMENEKY